MADPPTPYYPKYKSFNSTGFFTSAESRQQWQKGTRCYNSDLINNTSLEGGTFYCPMPFEPADYIQCCGSEDRGYCCKMDSNSSSQTLGIVLSLVVCGLAAVCAACCLCRKWKRKRRNSTPKSILKLHAGRYSVAPLNKRLLMKTGNYSVEQADDKVIMKFTNVEFFEKLLKAIQNRYKQLDCSSSEPEGSVMSSTGVPVGLLILKLDREIHVTRSGNLTWVRNDFQNICKNLIISDSGGTRTRGHLRRIILEPRLPTVGEEAFDAGEYKVKVCQTEVEIKFSTSQLYTTFIRCFQMRYPTSSWSKYLQRDCCQIYTDDGKSLTLHLWEDIATIWISGDGRKDWFTSIFQELVGGAISGRMSGMSTAGMHRKSISSVSSGFLSIGTPHGGPNAVREYPANYTVKPLDSGGYEIQFPSHDFLPFIKDLLGDFHPHCRWQHYTGRDVMMFTTARKRQVSIHIASLSSRQNKIWIFDEPGCKEWFNGEFKQLHSLAYEAVHNISAVAPVYPTNEDIGISPIECSSVT